MRAVDSLHTCYGMLSPVAGVSCLKQPQPVETTSRLAPMSANTAIHKVAEPAMAKTRNTALISRQREYFA